MTAPSYASVIRVQKTIVVLSIVLLGIKFFAYFSTGSVAILTDALESIVNVAAASITLVSLRVAARPRDWSHPYGHGKAEFISAGIEGTLIVVAGLLILYESIDRLMHPMPLRQLEGGIVLIALSALLNYGTGWWALRTGAKNQSLGIQATGHHLQSDAYSSLGLVAGLLLVYFTQLAWLDSAVALLFGIILLRTGYGIVRQSVAGIMDEADEQLLDKVAEVLNAQRQPNWIDLHNLRVIKYGNKLHIDCHLTLPWYFNLQEAHREVDAFTATLAQAFGSQIEFFVHTDGCLPQGCTICQKQDCTRRLHPFERRVEWSKSNIFENVKHDTSTS
jgi:cation diffusion facilitator family transporter